MSISSRLRWHATLTLGAAATAVLALAAPAGASTGLAQISPEQAGYTATGAQFKEVDATVYLRKPAQYSGEVGQYSHSVQLWSSDGVAVVGVAASTSGSGYTPYATIYDRSTHAVIASDPNAEICDEEDNCTSTIGSFAAGDTVILKLIYYPKPGILAFSVHDNKTRLTFLNEPGYPVGAGESFTQARVGTEFGSSPWDASYPHTPPADYVRIATYNKVALTSYSGHVSTLWSWWVHHKLLANTGQQSDTDWVAVPTDLSNGGASFQTWFVPQSAQSPHAPTAP